MTGNMDQSWPVNMTSCITTFWFNIVMVLSAILHRNIDRFLLSYHQLAENNSCLNDSHQSAPLKTSHLKQQSFGGLWQKYLFQNLECHRLLDTIQAW